MPIGESYQQYVKRKEQEKNNPLGLSPSIEKLDTQIDNAKARINDSGFNASDAGDDRNAFEKFANLPKGQNALFDTFDILGRPGNAIKNVIQNTLVKQTQDPFTSIYKGLSGRQNVSGSDLVKNIGLTGDDTATKVVRGVAGFGADVVLDPTTYIPGGVIAKGASKLLSPIAKGIKRGYQAIEDSSPLLRQIREEKIAPFAQKTKDAFGKAFIPTYRYGDQLRYDNEGNLIVEQTADTTLKDVRDEAQRTKDFLQEESIRNVSKAAQAAGLDSGTDVGRIMESNLQINKDAEELVSDILKGKPVKLNIADGDPQDLISRMNQDILNTPEVKSEVRSVQQNLSNIGNELKKIEGVDIVDIERRLKANEPVSAFEKTQYAEHQSQLKSATRLQDQIDRLMDIKDKLINEKRSTKSVDRFILAREKQMKKAVERINQITGKTYKSASAKTADELTEEEVKMLERYQQLIDARNKQTVKLQNIQRGIQFNPLTTAAQAAKGEGFEIINPMPKLFKKAAGSIRDLLQRISPKGSFEQVFKKEYQNELKPIVESLLKDGRISTNIPKDSPLLDELKRVLGNDIRITSDDEGSSIRLIQNDPNKIYYLLNQAKTEVPESMTNPIMQSGEAVFDEALPSDFPKLNEAGLFDEPRLKSDLRKAQENNVRVEKQKQEVKDEINRLDEELKAIEDQKEKAIKEIEDYIRESHKNRGGVRIIPDWNYENSGRGIRQSDNPIWYQRWYAEKGKKSAYISKAEYRRIAEKMYEGDYGGFDELGGKFEDINGITEQRQAIKDMQDTLKGYVDELNGQFIDESKLQSNVKNVEGKKYTASDRVQVRDLMRKNKNVNQEIRDLNKEISVMRKEELVALIESNRALGIKMNATQMNKEVEKALIQRQDFKEVMNRLNDLDVRKQDAKSLMQLLRMETLNQSKLNIQDLQFTDLLDLIKFDRPIRELSQSPIINVVAKQFTDNNNWLREFAAENGIDIAEIQGYMTHILSQEARKAKEIAKGKATSGTFGPMQGNKNVVKNRKYEGSAEDINELMDKVLFETNAFFSTAIGQKRLIEYIAAESAKRKLLANPNFAVKYVDGMNVPEGARLISPDQFKFFKVDTPEGNKFLSVKKGDQYIVTEPVFQLLERYQRAINDDGIRGVLKAVDTVTGTFKRLALFSPGYHIRNVLGAMWNNYVGGMDAKDLAKYTSEASNDITNAVFKDMESDLYREYREQGLSSNSLNKIDMALPGKEPEDIIREIVADKSKTTGERIADRINPLKVSSWKKAFETSREAGDFFDQINRFALYKWAREAKEMSADQARDLVKAVQFDYTDLTDFEKEIMVRVFPFYRWSRNNIPFQLQKLISEPQKFMKLYYANMEAKEEAKIDPNKQPDYMNNTFNLPFGNRREGNTLSLNLPAEDLLKVTSPSSFVKMMVDSINPALKLPIELTANRNLFTNKEIEKFAGQTSSLGLPMKLDYAIQTLGGQPGRALSGFAAKSESEQLNPASSTAKILGLPVKPYIQEKNEQIKKIQDLQKLQDYMSYIEQETGKRPRSVREIQTGTGR